MLTDVDVTNSQGDLLSLPLDDDTVLNGFVIDTIDGLDPVKATFSSSAFAQLPGEQFQSSHRETRNIKIRIELRPDFATTSVSALRQLLYDFFMPETEVNLKFYRSDDPSVNIAGRVETCDTPLFTKEPAVDVSIMCFNPDFYDPTSVILNGSSTSGTTETLLTYAGSVKTGIKFTLNVNRTVNEFSIYHRLPNNVVRTLDFSAPLISGDVLFISTVPGSKKATLTRSGTVSSILYGVSPQSNWTELMKGSNHIRVYAVGAGIPYTIEYTNLYGGL